MKITPIPGYEKHYGATRDGRVFSFDYRKTGKTKELAQSSLHDKRRKSKTMYRRAKMWFINKHTPTAVHRIIATTFIQNPNNYPQVNHKDGDKGNNNADNLEWCTNKQNIDHAENNGLADHVNGENHGMHILTEEEVIDIKLELSESALYRGQLKGIGDRYGVTYYCIWDIKAGRSWRHLA